MSCLLSQGDRLGGDAGASKLQAAPAECNLSRREYGHLATGQDLLDAGDGCGEALEGAGLVGSMHQPGRDIPAIGAVNFNHGVVALIEFEKPPFCGGAIQIGHALPHQRRAAVRDYHDESLDQEFSARALAADIQPENGEGQCRVDGSLSLGGIDAQEGECRLALAQQTAGIDGSKGFFEIDAGGQPGNGESGEMPFDHAAQFLLIAGPRCFLGGRRPKVALAANFQLGWTRLAQALHREPQRPGLYFGVEHPPHGIPLRRPQMQQAFVVFAGDGILGPSQIEGDGAILEHQGAGSFGEEVLHRAGEAFGGHGRIVHFGRARSL